MKHTTTRFRRLIRRPWFIAGANLVAIAAIASGCTLKEQDAPGLTGPSEFSTSLAITATPDILPQDGTSRSDIRIRAFDSNGQPKPGLFLRLDIVVNGVLVHGFGSLSVSSVQTDGAGEARAVFTAPPPPPDFNEPEPLVQILVTPLGTNFANTVSRSVSIQMVRPAVVQVPGAPFAEFTYSPAMPRVGIYVFFDARLSYDLDGVIVQYEWDYGDGERETGQTQSHDFMAPGNYNVTLTVTDDAGLKSSRTRTVAVIP